MATIPQKELRNNVGEVLRRADTGRRVSQDHAHIFLSQFARKHWKASIVSLGEARFENKVAADDQSVVTETLK